MKAAGYLAGVHGNDLVSQTPMRGQARNCQARAHSRNQISEYNFDGTYRGRSGCGCDEERFAKYTYLDN